MGHLLTADALIALVTLTALEVVLGIDNVVFLAILAAKLPPRQQPATRRLGLTLALGIRIGLLFAISWLMRLTEPLASVWGREVSGRSLILFGGGLFLIFKATWEIYERLEGEPGGPRTDGARAAFLLVLAQILLLDIVFSLDSVITAVGMANQVAIMITAMILAMLVMLVSAGPISEFVERHPSIRMLALAFLLLIGVMLMAEGMGTHVEKGYVYFAMAFSLVVELLNMRYRKRRTEVPMSDVLTVVARIHPKAGREAEVQALLVRMADAVRQAEPDCLIYRPHRLMTNPIVFLFYEQYRSDAAFEFHKTAPHLAAFRSQMRALLERPTEIELYRSLTA